MISNNQSQIQSANINQQQPNSGVVQTYSINQQSIAGQQLNSNQQNTVQLTSSNNSNLIPQQLQQQQKTIIQASTPQTRTSGVVGIGANMINANINPQAQQSNLNSNSQYVNVQQAQVSASSSTDEEMYNKKIEELQQHLPRLERMLANATGKLNNLLI